jgi:reactive intermediate/imine deaminase
MNQQLKPLQGEGLAAPMGHYSNAMIAGNTLYVSGLLSTDASGALVGAGDVGEQSQRVFENLGLMLSSAGCSPADVVKATIYMRDIGERLKMNAARKDFFGEHMPAGTLIEVSGLALPEFLIEVDAIAILPS